MMRVEVGFESEDVVVTCDKDFDMYADGLLVNSFKAGEEVFLNNAGDSIFSREGEVRGVYKDVVRFASKDPEGIMEIVNFEHRPTWDTSLNDNRFRGVIEARILNGKLNVINELDLESYVRGIAENSDSAPIEKLRAMAILARTYALFYIEHGGKHPERFSILNSSDMDQVYKGYGYELRSPNFADSADSTKGQVVKYQGGLYKFPYFTQSDGRTRAWGEVWNGDYPFLISVPDPCCTNLELKGHGVGLSGKGAEWAAKNGKSHKEILEYYYQGIDIVKEY
jgi:peptidoglycan hydrolase-like amidase